MQFSSLNLKNCPTCATQRSRSLWDPYQVSPPVGGHAPHARSINHNKLEDSEIMDRLPPSVHCLKGFAFRHPANKLGSSLAGIRPRPASEGSKSPLASTAVLSSLSACIRGTFAIFRLEGRPGLAWPPSLSLPLILQDTEWCTSSWAEPVGRAVSAEGVRGSLRNGAGDRCSWRPSELKPVKPGGMLVVREENSKIKNGCCSGSPIDAHASL